MLVFLASCRTDADASWVTSSVESEVRLISDTPDVRVLISSQEKADTAELRWLQGSQPYDERVRGVADRRRNPHKYAPTLTPFIKTMEAMSGIMVPGGTSCRVIERSQARCTPFPLDTFTYVKLRIVEGPKCGQEGWACEAKDVGKAAVIF